MPPETSLGNRNTSLTEILFNRHSNFKEKADQVESFYGIRSSAMVDFLIGWAQQNDPTEEVRALGGKNIIVGKFVEFQNLENADPGQKEGHTTLTNLLYSDALLPLVSAIDSFGKIHNDPGAIRDANTALFFLNEALDIIFHNQRHIDNLVATFTRMQTEAVQGISSDLQDFFTLIKIAKISAVETIQKHGDKTIILNPNIPIPKGVEKGSFTDLKNFALAEFESEKGTTFPEDFGERLKQSKTLAVSLDWNSVWNQSESYANGYLIAVTSTLLRNLADNFHLTFPDKEIYFVINTGRPALYAWGVVEALHAIKELRAFGLAESGTVILKEGMHSGDFTLTLSLIKGEFVPEPHEWKEELQTILRTLQSGLKPSVRLHNENKESSLALKIAAKNSPENHWLHQDQNDETITPNYVKKHLDSYFASTITQTKKLLRQTIAIASSKRLETILSMGEDMKAGTADDLSPQQLSALERTFSQFQEFSWEGAQKLTRRLKVLRYMQEKLVTKYNPTAGFLDIVHADINKYSSLRLVLEQLGFSPEESVVIHIGDSSSDNMPEEKTGKGEINEGADDVYLVGVGNSSPGYKETIEKRKPRNRGIIIPRKTILGLMDMIVGINNVVSSLR
ncbi:HAD family hydrolase [Patescibacteria group bacterium]|nr:HAD family hydrolase [Patescibacteria group bacterium]MBU1499867.1 HAD family hydrolase [Patescibacteria group bacterium]